MLKNIGIYMLVFFFVYTIIVIIASLMGSGLNNLKEYIGLKRKGYTEEHEETKGRENIYHSRLVGKPRVKRTVSEDARVLLEEVAQKKIDSVIEEDAVLEDEEDEEVLPNYMVEKVEPLEDVYEEPEGVKEKGTELLNEIRDASTSETGLLERVEDTGILNHDEDTGLLKKEKRSEETGILTYDDATGLLNEDRDVTGLLRRNGTGLLGTDIDINVFKGG